MLDSNPVKLINLLGALITIGGTVGGIFIGIEWRGDEWGRPLAATTFGLGFAFTSLAILVTVVGKLRRPCPVCRGRATVQTGFNEIMQASNSICPKCKGNGYIW